MLSKRDKVISQKILFRPTSKKTAMAEVYLLIAIKWDWILILILLFPRAWLRKDQKLEWNRLGTRKPKRCMSFWTKNPDPEISISKVRNSTKGELSCQLANLQRSRETKSEINSFFKTW